MANEKTTFDIPDQLDAMSQAYRAHADAAQTVAHQLSTGRSALLRLMNWGGDGFDDVDQLLSQFNRHMATFSDRTRHMAVEVEQAKANYLSTEATIVRSMGAEPKR